MNRIVDCGEVVFVGKPSGGGEAWLSPGGGQVASATLLEALAHGDFTHGGMSEAGWQLLGPWPFKSASVEAGKPSNAD